jgi:hypothetical protein
MDLSAALKPRTDLNQLHKRNAVPPIEHRRDKRL